ncbi:MAG: hypothetical protein Phog2KO_15490 [Phototrophicaceae bacterium]
MNIRQQANLPHQEYREVLMDFRDQLFSRFLWSTLIFIGACINLLLIQQPRPIPLIAIILIFMLILWQIKKLYRSRPNLARYLFVIMLYLGMFTAMRLEINSWTAYLIAPVLLISALLMSNSTPIGAIGFMGFAWWLSNTGYSIDLQSILIFTLISFVTITITVSTFNVALSWYSSMHHHADKLLGETRERRAELVNSVKSLETAYQTQRGLQQQLIYARQQAEESRRMKERFASNISHELRTPLNIILGFSEIMYLTPEIYGNMPFPPKFHRDIYQIHHNSKHLLAMIDDVLDLSHIEMSEFALNFERTDMNQFLADAVNMLDNYFNTEAVQFSSFIAPNLPNIEIDRTRIRQVLINLITNARRFTEYGTVILRVRPKDTVILFEVEDTGKGIPPDKLELIFEEFYQVDYSLSRQHGGAGLGLAITKQFVTAHYGTLTVDSQYGHGSTFTFTLPIPAKNEIAYPRQSQKGLPNKLSEKPTILLIDTDPHTSALLSRHLNAFSIVQLNNINNLDTALLEHLPIAIIHNRLPNQTPLESTDIPIIECTLPSSQWMSQELNITMSLAKPITPQQIKTILQNYDHVNNILLVDDEIGFVQLIQRSIESLETTYTIRRAYDGLQAYDIIQTDTPDLIFLDLSMPEMDGFELITALQSEQKYQDIPIILLTATQYIQSDSDWLSQLEIHQAGGFTFNQTIQYLKAILGTKHSSRTL